MNRDRHLIKLPEIWTDDCRRLGDKMLYEQFLDQTDSDRLSMLTIDGAP